MRKLVILLGALLITGAGTIASAQDDSGAAELSTVSTFNRQLVQKIEKGCIYIWMMGSEQTGYMTPLGIGSGVIFMAAPEENAAYALTNHHVAGPTTLMQVETWDRATYKARMVASDPGIDCALIKIEDIPRDRYEPCALGNSDEVVIGDMALAVGAPGTALSVNVDRMDPLISFGLHQTTTMRVVTGRLTDPYQLIGWWAGWNRRLGRQVLTNLPWRFVTQAPISGGNSGGPLFNSKGEVIGLNHAHFGAGPAITQSENYTIPVNFCKTFAFQILEKGKYELPWFGMDVLIPKHFNTGYGVREFAERYLDPDKIEVFGVRKDSPAERAGLQKGDIISEFDGRTFADLTELRLYIFELPIGKEVPVTVKRDRQQIDLVMVVGPKRSYDSEFSL